MVCLSWFISDNLSTTNSCRPPRTMSGYQKCMLYILALSYLLSGSIFSADVQVRSSGKLWKLDAVGDRVVSVTEADSVNADGFQNTTMFLESLRIEQDKILTALLSTDIQNGIWTKRETTSFCQAGAVNCGDLVTTAAVHVHKKTSLMRNTSSARSSGTTSDPPVPLSCGKPVNFTHYDHLEGVSRRTRHPRPADARGELALLRRRTGTGTPASTENTELDQWERALRERPKSLQLYNDVGNFWRVKGDAGRAIECFRRSLAVSPNNAEVLLNLARLLFGLQYLDDATFLARRSLELQPPDQSAWLQHFTLGQILKEYGSYQEAELHLRHVLQLRPHFQPAEQALLQLQATPGSRLHGCTAAIIFLLVCVVLVFMFSSSEATGAGEPPTETASGGAVGWRASRNARARSGWRRPV